MPRQEDIIISKTKTLEEALARMFRHC